MWWQLLATYVLQKVTMIGSPPLFYIKHAPSFVPNTPIMGLAVILTFHLEQAKILAIGCMGAMCCKK